MTSLIVETYEPSGPYGMKGVGEVGINGPLPAIANAVADACDIGITRAPLTAERILEKLTRRMDERGRTAPLNGGIS
ncbi:MAG: hypothetical protein U1D97_12515 [Desulfuromonadales bacterium]|nr:hypothetical protein [Desulfuromonadales bacterium]